MGLLTTWPRLLLAANGLLMVLGTGMAMRGGLGTRTPLLQGSPTINQYAGGPSASMDMPEHGSMGSMAMPQNSPMVLLHMPSLGPMQSPEHNRLIASSPTQNAPIGVDALVGPRTAVRTSAFTLVARPARIMLAPGTAIDAWTYNGTAPGPVLRVHQGDLVVVHLVNRLSVATTIHWHGISVPGGEDGVAGLTQDAVPPGHTYTYRFVASEPGTYWYHAHQDSLTQVQRGLFGAVVVAPRQPAPHDGVDTAITLHTWTPGGPDVLTANGSAGILHLTARPGVSVRLRLINTDSTIHIATLAGTSFTVVALDGHDLHGPTPLQGVALPIGAGQRYDVRFRIPASGAVALRIADVAADQHRLVDPRRAVLVGAGAVPSDSSKPYTFDMTTYGTPVLAPHSPYNRPGPAYTLRLGAMGGFSFAHPGITYTINGETAPTIAPIMVKRGQVVHLHIVNDTAVVHPMHLHGHTFAVLKRNGRSLTGSPIMLDTLDVFPNESYDVTFIADNPGVWMLHCHNLIHARQGMSMMVMYEGVVTPFKDGGAMGNISD